MPGPVAAADRIAHDEVAVIFGEEASAVVLLFAGWSTRWRDCWVLRGVAGLHLCQIAVVVHSLIAWRACMSLNISESA